MAVLDSLYNIKSSLLPHYVALAIKDGREHLVKKALLIESEIVS